MERWNHHYGTATYGPAPNWRWRSGHRPATQGLQTPVLGLSLEAVNGHRHRLSCDGSSKSPWGARNAPEYHPPDPKSNDRSTRSLGVVKNHNRPTAPVGIPPKRTVAQAARELGRLRIVRNYLTKANPWLCTGCPDVQHRLKLRRIVQRGETDGHNSWNSLATREQRRATIGAKAASREPATASTNRVRLRRAGDRYVRHPHDEAGSERSAT
jgi:hypothetical protein